MMMGEVMVGAPLPAGAAPVHLKYEEDEDEGTVGPFPSDIEPDDDDDDDDDAPSKKRKGKKGAAAKKKNDGTAAANKKKGKGARSSDAASSPKKRKHDKPISEEFTGPNTPPVAGEKQRRAPRSKAFQFIKRARELAKAMSDAGYDERTIKAAEVAGYTHVCALCSSFINMGYCRLTSSWVTTKANDHIRACPVAIDSDPSSRHGACVPASRQRSPRAAEPRFVRSRRCTGMKTLALTRAAVSLARSLPL